MGDTTRCPLCECPLTVGNYEFRAHDRAFCERGVLYRIETLTRMLTKQCEETAILRDMMARHVCAPAASAPEEGEK